MCSSCSATFGAQLCTKMPRQLKLLADEPGLPGKLAAAFAKEEKLKTVGHSFCFCFFFQPDIVHPKVGFNFVRAHSEGLFGKGPATLKDCFEH